MTDDAQLRWTDDWESMPSTRTAAQSDRYQRGRPERVVAAADAPFAKFVIAAPGGDQALQYQVATGSSILSRKLTPRDALNDAVANVQRELDAVARTCNL